jgi:threonine dehydrogenase-like Zn-dependent dehydrogenase
MKSRQVILREFNRPLDLYEVEVGDPGPGELIVRVDFAGVCGSDLHTWKGEFSRALPITLGHEGVGTVVSAGSGVKTDHAGIRVRAGDRVYWCPLLPCNQCHYCSVEHDVTNCENAKIYGTAGQPNWNSYADFVKLPSGLAFYRIPDDTPSQAIIALGCALPTILQAFDRLGPIRPGSSLVVQGCGPVGLAAVLVAKSLGAGFIVVVDRIASRLAMARTLGATDSLLASPAQESSERREKILTLIGGRGADIAIEATGAISAFSEGISLLAPGGRYLLVGLWAGLETAQIDPHHILRKNLRVIGSAYAAFQHYQRAIEIVQRHSRELPLAQIVTGLFRLGDVLNAFEAMEQGRAGKAVLVPF